MLNTVVTNVPGPTFQQYFCGARLVDALSLGPLLPSIGLFHVVYSAVQNRQGSITLSFTACREMLPDPAAYVACLEAAFQELLAQLPTSAPPGKQAAAATRAPAKGTRKAKPAAKTPRVKASRARPGAAAKARPKTRNRAER